MWSVLASPKVLLMKSTIPTLGLLWMLACGSAPTLLAQSFSIDWYTIDGGGGTSSGGPFSLTGTIAEPETAVMSGGGFTIEGGFWAILSVVPTPGAPSLRVALTSTNTVVVAWPAVASGYDLQQTPSLESPTWSATAPAPIQVGDEKQVILPVLPGNLYFRLRSQ
jgi:hypothetical protein